MELVRREWWRPRSDFVIYICLFVVLFFCFSIVFVEDDDTLIRNDLETMKTGEVVIKGIKMTNRVIVSGSFYSHAPIYCSCA